MKDLYIRKMSLIDSPPKDSYLNRLPVVKHLAEHGIEFHKQVTFFVGENGSGKSTLIEALAVSQGFNPEGGRRISAFQRRIPIRACITICGFPGERCIPGTGSSCGRKAFTMWQAISTSWTGNRASGVL